MSIAHQEPGGHSPIGLAPHTNGNPSIGLEQFQAAQSTRQPQPDVTSIYGPDGTPDPQRLQAALDLAQKVIPLQEQSALLQVKSDNELQQMIEQARQHRAAQREQDDQDHQVEIELRELRRQARRRRAIEQLEHEENQAARQRAYEQAVAEATAERERLTNPLTELVAAHRAKVWLPKLALVPAVVASVVSAANLATQGARIVDAQHSWLGAVLGAGVDVVFTIGLMAIILGRMSGAVTTFLSDQASHDDRRGSAWYLAGEIGLGLALGAANVAAHHLPSADGSEHTAELGWWFLLLPLAFGFSTIFAPRLQRSTVRRLVYAARQTELAAEYGTLDADDRRVLRLVRWLAEHEHAIEGERDENGLPSVSSVDRAIRKHFGRSSKPLARRVLDTYALVSGKVQ